MDLFKNNYLYPVLAAMLWVLPVCAQDRQPDSTACRISIRCEIPDLEVWIDGARIGSTPVEDYPIAPGEHTVRIQHPNPFNWLSRDWEETIRPVPGERCELIAVFPEYVWIGSTPIGASVYRSGHLLGETPLLVRRVQAEGDKLEVTKSGYLDAVLLLGNVRGSRISVELFRDEFRIGNTGVTHRIKKGWIIGTAVFALLSGITGYYYKDRAEQAYDKYMNTAHPDKMDRYFNEAAKFDKLSGIFYGIGEVSLSVSVVLSIKSIRSN
jgi:hypothetical protein